LFQAAVRPAIIPDGLLVLNVLNDFESILYKLINKYKYLELSIFVINNLFHIVEISYRISIICPILYRNYIQSNPLSLVSQEIELYHSENTSS
jgi:hypothetical protein